MGNNDIKVKDLSTTSSLSTDNKLMLLTDEANNTVQNITVENALANIISSNANNSLSVGSDKKLYTRDISGEVGDLDNLITTDKTDIVSAINEVKGDTNAITGEVVSASKGWLEEGKIYQKAYWYGEKIYNDVYTYNHSTFDLSKFTKVGSPTITVDGIASGFSTSNYLTVDTSNIDLLTANTWEIDFTVKLNNSTATTQMYFDTFESGVSSTLRFDYNNPNNQNAFRMLLVATDNTRIFDYATIKQNIVLNTWYKFKLSYTGTHYIIKDADGNILKDVESNKKVNLTSRILVGKRQANDQPLTNGSIDLKQFSITVNGTPIFIGTKTGIDTIKPADYTEIGTGLTITDEGIASGFTNTGARLEASIDFTNMNTFSIEGKFYHSGVSNGGRSQNIFAFYDTTLNTNRLLLYNQSSGGANVLWNYPASDSTMSGDGAWFSYTRNAWQTFKFDYDGTNIKLYINGVLRKTSSNVDKTWLQSNYTLLIGNSNLSTVYNSNYTGQIDLSSFKIYVNGDLVYQPCLLIPYNESSTGSKIVDVAYRDRVIDVYQQYGSANYYTIDETNQNATLPMGEIYGFIRQADSDKIYKDLVPCYDSTKAISVPLLGNYTAPADGYVCSPNMVLVLDPDNGYENFNLTITRNTQSMTMISCTGPTAFPFCLSVLKDDVLTVAADATVTSNVYFIPREGV